MISSGIRNPQYRFHNPKLPSCYINNLVVASTGISSHFTLAHLFVSSAFYLSLLLALAVCAFLVRMIGATPQPQPISREKPKPPQVSKGTVSSSNILYIRKYPDLRNKVITVKKDFIFLFFFPLSILLFLSTFTFFKRFFWGPQLNLIIWKSEWVTVLILKNIINSQYYDKLQFLSFL